MSSVGGGGLKIFQYCFPLASGVLEKEAQSQSGLGKNFLVGVLAGYCRSVLRGAGGYWWVLEGIGEQRRIEIGVLKRMATYTKYNILQRLIS